MVRCFPWKWSWLENQVTICNTLYKCKSKGFDSKINVKFHRKYIIYFIISVHVNRSIVEFHIVLHFIKASSTFQPNSKQQIKTLLHKRIFFVNCFIINFEKVVALSRVLKVALFLGKETKVGLLGQSMMCATQIF